LGGRGEGRGIHSLQRACSGLRKSAGIEGFDLLPTFSDEMDDGVASVSFDANNLIRLSVIFERDKARKWTRQFALL
jgi:hypothetical protein